MKNYFKNVSYTVTLSSGPYQVQTVCKGYQRMTKVAACKEIVKPFVNIHGAYEPVHMHSLISVMHSAVDINSSFYVFHIDFQR